MLKGMEMVQKMGGKAVRVFSDSKLVVGQVSGDLEVRDSRMLEYLCQVRGIQESLKFLTCLMFLEVGTPMQIRWPPLPRPRPRICLG